MHTSSLLRLVAFVTKVATIFAANCQTGFYDDPANTDQCMEVPPGRYPVGDVTISTPAVGEWSCVRSSPDFTTLIGVLASSTDTPAKAKKVYRSDDAGATWVALTNLPANKQWQSAALTPDKQNYLFGTSGTAGESSTSAELYKSADGGNSFTQISNVPTDKQYSSLVTSYDAKCIFVAGESNLYLSTDSGANWSSFPNWTNARVTANADCSLLWVLDKGTSRQGLWYSQDKGESWTQQTVVGVESKQFTEILYQQAFVNDDKRDEPSPSPDGKYVQCPLGKECVPPRLVAAASDGLWSLRSTSGDLAMWSSSNVPPISTFVHVVEAAAFATFTASYDVHFVLAAKSGQDKLYQSSKTTWATSGDTIHLPKPNGGAKRAKRCPPETISNGGAARCSWCSPTGSGCIYGTEASSCSDSCYGGTSQPDAKKESAFRPNVNVVLAAITGSAMTVSAVLVVYLYYQDKKAMRKAAALAANVGGLGHATVSAPIHKSRSSRDSDRASAPKEP